MAFVKQCDRCKRIYKDITCECKFYDVEPDVRIISDKGEGKTYDLCPECVKKVIELVEGKEDERIHC